MQVFLSLGEKWDSDSSKEFIPFIEGRYCKLQPTMSWGRFFSKILPKISQIAKNSLRIPLQFLPEKVLRPAAFQTVPLNSPRKLSLSEKFSLIRDRILPEKFSRKTFPGHGRLKFAIVRIPPSIFCESADRTFLSRGALLNYSNPTRAARDPCKAWVGPISSPSNV